MARPQAPHGDAQLSTSAQSPAPPQAQEVQAATRGRGPHWVAPQRCRSDDGSAALGHVSWHATRPLELHQFVREWQIGRSRGVTATHCKPRFFSLSNSPERCFLTAFHKESAQAVWMRLQRGVTRRGPLAALSASPFGCMVCESGLKDCAAQEVYGNHLHPPAAPARPPARPSPPAPTPLPPPPCSDLPACAALEPGCAGLPRLGRTGLGGAPVRSYPAVDGAGS